MLRVASYSLYHSSNSYLGVILAGRALRGLPVQIERRPLCVPKARGTWAADLVGGRVSPRHGRWHREDCARWAAKHGIPMRFPSAEETALRMRRWQELPFAREELPARAYYAALGSGHEDALDAALFRAGYVDGRDVNDEVVLRRCIEDAGLDPAALLERAGGDEAERRLTDALADFDRDECPGVPTWVVDGERFWGKDRVDWLTEKVRALYEARELGA